ncbi:LTA synthase family protein [Trichococcus ilyis]|uniref:Phosphoglycerol transferase MdoB n=1 Tax=Trichococcus ilyis TaxID=640938 RepID=A0A143Y9S3_9LACT|nr:LTA synthase family protein [Trichococcus ilyis]CZQ83852.1 sulfatase [Trichococcus ilyis]SEJ32563.1 Phosphoglycerol transferase MdoB [Trichococcus ilyis]
MKISKKNKMMNDKQELQCRSRRHLLLLHCFSLLATVVLVHLYLQWTQNGLDPGLVVNFAFAWHTEKFLISTGVLLTLGLWLWALLGNIRWTNALLLLAGGILGMATYEKMLQRNEPVYPSDLKMLTEVPFLLEMLNARTLAALSLTLALFLAFAFFSVRQQKSQKAVKLGWRARVLLLVSTSVALAYAGQFQQEGNLLKQAYDRTAYWIPYSQQMNYYNTGFVAGFLYNLSAAPMEMPDGYSEKKIDELKATYQRLADEINAERTAALPETNVIYIMNESFADPLELEGLDLLRDPIPFTRGVMETSYSGEMLSQGYGGGTANIEFEALTGFSMEPFAANITTPYTQFLSSQEAFPSVVSRLEAAGFRTTAIHPYNTTMYKRRENYQALGFDTFLYEDTMANTDKLDTNPYISDAAAYAEIEAVLKASAEKDFIHLVTMQNHTPYQNKYTITPSAAETGVASQTIRNYLQDLQYSDQALERFFTDLKEWGEPTVVVFWGDHWPSVFGEDLYALNTVQNMHETPMFIYSNTAEAQKDLGITSPVYFLPEVLELSGSKVTAFEALLMTLQEQVPAFEKALYRNGDTGEYVSSREELSEQARSLLADYDLIQYDTTAGNRYAAANGFFRLDD